LDDDISKKTLLLRCHETKGVLSGDYTRDWKKFSSQLPAFCFFVDKFPVPKAWQDIRFGVSYYHDPYLAQMLDDMSSESKLQNIIDEVLFKGSEKGDPLEFWQGNSEELERKLQTSEHAGSVYRLFSFPNACGTFLSRLEKRKDRVTSKRPGNRRVWRIEAPKE
jgi:hypothetical protein